MPQVNPLTRELLVKLVYYGPGLGGKTTSLQRIHAVSPSETRGQLVSLATPVDRTLYFDFLPIRIAAVRGHHVRLQLFTVPGQVYFNATRKLVLTGADGVVFVADSQRERHDANLESLENLAANLEEQERSLAEIPMVFQYNKRDLPNVLSMEELDRSLNAMGARAFPTCATKGEGVLEALDSLVQLVLEDLEARHALGDPSAPVEEPAFSPAESSLEEQIGRASEQMWRPTVDKAVHRARGPDPDATIPATDPVAASIAPKASVEPKVETPVEAAVASEAVRPVPVRAGGPSWVTVFPEEETEVREVEHELSHGRWSDAIGRCEVLAARILMRVAVQAGLSDEPAVAVSLLGIGGERWLAFRKLVRRAREGGPIDRRDALEAFGLLIELRLRHDRLMS